MFRLGSSCSTCGTPTTASRLPLWSSAGALVLATFLVAGCGGDSSSSPGERPGTLNKIFTYIEIQNCGTCHAPDGMARGGPDMSTADTFFRDLVERDFTAFATTWFPAPTSICSTENFPYVKPGDPNGSALLAAVTNPENYGYSGCEGTWRYHDRLNSAIDGNEALIDDIILWIRNGARR